MVISFAVVTVHSTVVTVHFAMISVHFSVVTVHSTTLSSASVVVVPVIKRVAPGLRSLADYVECEVESFAGRAFSRPAVDIVLVRDWRGIRAVCRRL
jgi:hypothetical protein